jgi:hypothetical protein
MRKFRSKHGNKADSKNAFSEKLSAKAAAAGERVWPKHRNLITRWKENAFTYACRTIKLARKSWG